MIKRIALIACGTSVAAVALRARAASNEEFDQYKVLNNTVGPILPYVKPVTEYALTDNPFGLISAIPGEFMVGLNALVAVCGRST